MNSTKDKGYAAYLVKSQQAGWKKALDVQRPYRNKLIKLNLGKTLDVGCGIGRNLMTLSSDSIGIDHNESAIKYLVSQGYNAQTVSKFKRDNLTLNAKFDSMLFAHIIEHMSYNEAKKMIHDYLKYLKRQGRVVVICPQIKGFGKDDTHIEFYNRDKIRSLLEELDLKIILSQSFPFAEFTGKYFAPNEYWVAAQKS